MILMLILIVTLFIFLFTFYMYARDDYSFIRKNITMEQLFNVLFLGLLWGFLLSRIVFVVLHFKQQFLNPIIFFLVPYEPGLSLVGWIIGIFLGSIYLTKRRKIHTARFLDYVAIALTTTIPVWNIGMYLSIEKKEIILFLPIIMYIVLFVIFTYILIPKFIRGKLKEGSISLLFLLVTTLISLSNAGLLMYLQKGTFGLEEYIFAGIGCTAFLLLIRLQTLSRGK